MQLYILAEFVSLVETCSFQETAALMHISQSSLTKHIQKLEDELGVTLFVRSQHGVKASEYGNHYYPYAKQIVQLQADAAAGLKKMSDQGKNALSIVFNPILGQYGLIDTISDFSKKFPHCQIQTFEHYHALDFAKDHKCDFAFVDESEACSSNLEKLVYKTDHLALLVRADHPLANLDSVMLKQLADEQFIIHASTMDKIPDETKKFHELCAASNFEPNIVADSKFTSTIIRHVRAGRGIAVLNRMRIQHDLTDIRIVDIYPPVNSYIYMLYPKELSSSYSREFLRYMKERSNP